MADNIIRGIIKLEAQGVPAVVSQVTKGVDQINERLRSTGPAGQSFGKAVERSAEAMKKLSGPSNQATQSILNFSRVAQDAPFGILGIANNLNPLFESLTRTSAAAKEAGTTLGSSLKNALTGPAGVGLAIGVVSSLLITFGDKLFGSSVSFSAAEIAAGQFSNELKNVRKELEELDSRLDFRNKFTKLANELSGLKGPDLTIKNAETDITTETGKLTERTAKLQELTAKQNEYSKAIEETNKTLRSSTKFNVTELDLLTTRFKGIQNIPEEFIKKLDKSGQSVVSQFRAVGDEIAKIKKEINDISGNVFISVLGVAKGQVDKITEANEKRKKDAEKSAEDQKRIIEKSKADFERYVNETISQAKRYSEAFKGVIDLKLDGNFFDTKEQTFQKSLKFLNDFKNNKFKITLNPELSDADFKAQLDLFTKTLGKVQVDIALPKITQADIDAQKENGVFFDIDANVKKVTFDANNIKTDADRMALLFGKEMEDYFKGNPPDPTIKPKLDLEGLNKKINSFLSSAFGGFNTVFPDIPDDLGFNDIEKNAIKAGAAINNVLQPAFNGLFDAILAGKSPLEGFFTSLGKSVQQLIQKLISAAITAAILSAIFPGGVGGAKGFGAIFGKILGFAGGGEPPVGRPSLVGEDGPELFIPKTAGTIIPNKKTNELLKSGLLDNVSGFLATGGRVKTNEAYVVGEQGREVFIPDGNKKTSIIQPVKEFVSNSFSSVKSVVSNSFSKSFQSILSPSFSKSFSNISNSFSRSFGGVSSIINPSVNRLTTQPAISNVGRYGGMSIEVTGEFRQRGRDLVASVTRSNQSLNRLT